MDTQTLPFFSEWRFDANEVQNEIERGKETLSHCNQVERRLIEHYVAHAISAFSALQRTILAAKSSKGADAITCRTECREEQDVLLFARFNRTYHRGNVRVERYVFQSDETAHGFALRFGQTGVVLFGDDDTDDDTEGRLAMLGVKQSFPVPPVLEWVGVELEERRQHREHRVRFPIRSDVFEWRRPEVEELTYRCGLSAMQVVEAMRTHDWMDRAIVNAFASMAIRANETLRPIDYTRPSHRLTVSFVGADESTRSKTVDASPLVQTCQFVRVMMTRRRDETEELRVNLAEHGFDEQTIDDWSEYIHDDRVLFGSPGFRIDRMLELLRLLDLVEHASFTPLMTLVGAHRPLIYPATAQTDACFAIELALSS